MRIVSITLLLNILLESWSINSDKGNKDTQVLGRNKKQFKDDMFDCLENPRETFYFKKTCLM